jgi:hypothetical protein
MFCGCGSRSLSQPDSLLRAVAAVRVSFVGEILRWAVRCSRRLFLALLAPSILLRREAVRVTPEPAASANRWGASRTNVTTNSFIPVPVTRVSPSGSCAGTLGDSSRPLQ